MNIIEKLEDAMKAAKLSRPELIRKSGVPKSTLSQIFTGERILGRKTAVKLAAALGVSPASLLNIETPVERNLVLIGAAAKLARKFSSTDADGQEIFDAILGNWLDAQGSLQAAEQNISQARNSLASAAQAIKQAMDGDAAPRIPPSNADRQPVEPKTPSNSGKPSLTGRTATALLADKKPPQK